MWIVMTFFWIWCVILTHKKKNEEEKKKKTVCKMQNDSETKIYFYFFLRTIHTSPTKHNIYLRFTNFNLTRKKKAITFGIVRIRNHLKPVFSYFQWLWVAAIQLNCITIENNEHQKHGWAKILEKLPICARWCI